jgi:pyruvate/2-oxoglutarate/acetoin dehydrogenase E1 component|tara:strand:+ start:111 stop:650 length:540 start_codon:yes stop_codon:yes gene_type:complete
MKKYKEELIRSMNFLSKNKKVIFLGQSVKFSGNAIFNTLKEVDDKKKIELPVFEDVQMGISTGLALEGYIPVTCYPRFDFLILAMNQLVNHLDKIRQMSLNEFKPRVIIRTSIGSKKPLDGGVQHTQDYSKVFKDILTEVEVVNLTNPNKIFFEYKKALLRKDKKSTLLIENGDFYNSK